MTKHPLTDEQADICSIRLSVGEVMVIKAFAGSGKTSVLEAYAEAHRDLKFIYMALSKTAATDAQQRFGPHCMCKTTHAIAFGDVGQIYRDKLGEPKAKQIMHEFGLRSPTIANQVIETLNNYLHTASVDISKEHLPHFMRIDRSFTPAHKDYVLEMSNRLWGLMCDPNTRSVPMSHDGYLKLWQTQSTLTGRPPRVFDKYDGVFLDEAQDTNPTMEAIMRLLLDNGKHRLMFVGDSRQNIFGYRGSVNVMERACEDIQSKKTKGYIRQLSISFRYTSVIAKVATEILNADVKHLEDKVEVKGFRPVSDTAIESEAIIGRSNGGIIGAAIQHLLDNPEAKIHFAATTLKGNWDPTVLYKFDEMMGVWLHSRGRGNEGRSPYIRTFRDYKELLEYAKGENGQGGDKELEAYLRVVDRYGAELPELLDLIVRSCGPPEGVLSFSTAHRSKGLEWDRVTLLDDFTKPCKMTTFDSPIRIPKEHIPTRDELNLLYVASTRPRKELVMHPDLSEFMSSRWGKEHTVVDDIDEDSVYYGGELEPEDAEEPETITPRV